MLYNLHVKNLALIDEAEVEFGEGLNVLTGETGAGKSIVIDSINLVLGSRVPKGIIREGESEALIELIFIVDNEIQRKHLIEKGINPEDDQVLISRKISEKRTINRINGENVTASKLREVAMNFIDIHGQNEHQSLLKVEKHRQIIDEFNAKKINPVKEKLKEAYDNFKKIKSELNENSIPEDEKQREISFLSFELKEINDARLKHGEEEELAVKLKKLSNAQQIGEGLGNVYGFISADSGASNSLSEAISEMKRIEGFDEKLSDFSKQLSELDALMNDFSADLSSYMQDFETDDEELLRVESRLDLIRNLKAKYGNTTNEIKEYATKVAEKLDFYEKSAERTKQLEGELEVQKENIKKYSTQLTDLRKKSAEKFDKQLVEALKDLNFNQVVFETSITKSPTITAEGADVCEFMISMNPGIKPRPLIDAASGGELSRIMLALKSLLSTSDDIGTLIFDEIDSGISGRTAQKVAEKMVKISKQDQVICISHLAQIASMADSHFLIEKESDKNDTKTHIRKLNEDQETEELARILGGVSITDAIRQSAKEMKELAKKEKEKIK